MDFYRICSREVEKGPHKGDVEVYPDFKVGRSTDLMVRGRSFYAVWDEEAGLWSTDEYAVVRLVDAELRRYAERMEASSGKRHFVKDMQSFNSNSWKQFRQFLQNISDNSNQLDQKLTFANTDVKKGDYVSRRLPYSLVPGDYSAWDELVGTLYDSDQREKIEWIIGAVVSGDSKTIQKFGVFYGPPASGKSTMINIIQKLFEGYTTTFDAKALGGGSSQFATEVFKDNPLIAVQHDGDLSRIEDNARLNSIISHEDMPMNEKYKASYTSKVNAFLIMGTNQPVRISDAKSGIIRRLIDIHPSGKRIAANHYHSLMAKIDFELGAIAHHCLEVYRSLGKNYYASYRPLEMMFQTDVFFNFIEAHYDIFKAQEGVSLQQAYAMYREFCSDTGIERGVLPRHKVREELRNYFDEFHERKMIDGQPVRSYYSGFTADKFKAPVQEKDEQVFSLVLDDTISLLDLEFAEQPAQYSKQDELGKEIPAQRWSQVKTSLAEIDSHKLHFVKVPEQHIVIDFDLKDEEGNKSLELNLQAASDWPATYAELSQGGNGVHLHYNYEGDVHELAQDWEPGIEVKTLLGDASLRRRLTKCNNVPVASLNNRLRIKEKKPVLNVNTIKSEKGLRDLIARNMRKEIHPGTKPSIDFIKKILDDAYDEGLEYDLSDLHPKLIAFANSSTNQSLQCLKTVQQMKFKSDHEIEVAPILEEPVAAEDAPIVFYDVEVYQNLFVICWKKRGDANLVKMINPTPSQVEDLFKFKLVGFNNRRYDNHILYARFMGYDNAALYKLSQKIIEGKIGAMFGEAYNLSYADIYDFSSVKQSLKKFMIELGMTHMEMSIPWDEPVPDEMVDIVVQYCCNDVEGTEATFEARKADFVARQILADLSGLTVNDTTQKHTARIIFGADRNPQSKFKYTHLEEMFEGYDYSYGKSTYRDETTGEGGYVYAEPGIYENVAVLDVASMHPTSIVELNLFGDEYTQNFKELLDARIAIKHGDYDGARGMLGGKLGPHLSDPSDAKALSYALKIVINIVYGLTSAKFDNAFKDQRNKDNIVAKRGALFMIDLKHAVQELGFQVVHIKTDSIKIPNATPELIADIMEFGKKYGYDFEHEATYKKFCLVNDAVYIARKEDDTWEAVGAQFQHPYVYKTLFSGEETTFDDMCETKQVVKGAIYLDFQHDTPEPKVERMQFIGRIGRFIPVTQESGGAVIYRVVDEKLYAVAGTKGFLWIEADKAALNPSGIDVDRSYFDKLLDNAYKTVEKFGDFNSLVS